MAITVDYWVGGDVGLGCTVEKPQADHHTAGEEAGCRQAGPL